MASVFAQSRNSLLLVDQRDRLESRRSFHHNQQMEIMVVPKYAIVCAKSFASINLTLHWSRPTPRTSVAPRPCAKRRESKSRISSHTWPTGPRKTAIPCSASSIVMGQQKKVSHETVLRESPSRRSIGYRLSSGWIVSRPGRSSAISLARAETLLLNPLRCSRAPSSGRMFDNRPPLLHAQSHVEIELVPARLQLRHRAIRKRRNR